MAHVYAWTEMPRASTTRALEPHYRAAIVAATTALERILDADGEVPLFSGGQFASPKNATAVTVAAEVEQAIAAAGEPQPTGSKRTTVLTIAVRSAFVVRTGGFGDAGWAALMTLLARRA